MKDLIYNNPTTNRMPSTIDAEEKRKKRRRESAKEAKQQAKKAKQAAEGEDADGSAGEGAAAEPGEGAVAESSEGAAAEPSEGAAAEPSEGAGTEPGDAETPAPVPPPPPEDDEDIDDDEASEPVAAVQVMIDPETGEIVVNKASLVQRAAVTSTESRSETVVQNPITATYASFTSRSSNMQWTKGETDLFFKGLSAFGTDFGMIQTRLIPGRDHNQLKKKFHREDKKNRARVDAALKPGNRINVEDLPSLASLTEAAEALAAQKAAAKASKKSRR